MWSGLLTLLFLCLCLAVSSYLAGSIPLFFSLNQRHTRLLTACGTGILVGTALIVIIPEGVETLYSARPSIAHGHSKRTSGSIVQGLVVRDHRSITADNVHRDITSRDDLDAIVVVRSSAGDKASDNGESKHAIPAKGKVGSTSMKITETKDEKSPKQKHTKPVDSSTDHDNDDDDDDETEDRAHQHDFEPHAWVGVSIITGFILMYLIDKLPKLAIPKTSMRPAYISLQGMGFRSSADSTDDAGLQHSSRVGDIRPSSTTMGLVIHATTDGIALGASTTVASQRLSFIIFIALMIHKAPAAFGLVAVLLKQGLSKREAKAHLAVFSLAAPVGAIVTWIFVHLIGRGSLGRESSTVFVTALLLLFSGGTFLYVAMHTMQDSGQHDANTDHDTSPNGFGNVYQSQAPKQEDRPTLVDTLATVGGMLLPLLTLFGHHSH